MNDHHFDVPCSISHAVWALALVAMMCNGAFAKPRRTEVPFIYEDNRIYVAVSSARGSLGWFILDTGVAEALIDTSIQNKLNLTALSKETSHGAGVGELNVVRSSATTLLLGKTSLQVPNTRVAAISRVLAPYTGREIGGIIGGILFRGYVVTIDFERNKIELHEPATFRYHGNGIIVSFHLTNGVPLVDGMITLADGSQLAARLLVDLGAKSNLLISQPFVDEHKLLDRITPSVIEPLGAGLGGETRYAFVKIPRLTVGSNLSLSDFIAGLSVQGTLRGGYYDALLGVPALRHYRITIDYSRKRLILESTLNRELPRFDKSGVFVIADTNTLLIHYVVPDSPGDKAGLKQGDVLVNINSVPASSYSLAQVRSVLEGTGTDNVEMTVLRDGVQVRTSIHLRKLL